MENIRKTVKKIWEENTGNEDHKYMVLVAVYSWLLFIIILSIYFSNFLFEK